MFQHQGIWLPDGEKHFPEWMSKNGELVDGKGTYQIKKLREALKYCNQFRIAVDVGAHVGLWSMQLAKRFDGVHAFEPVEEYRDCFEVNLEEIGLQTRKWPALHSCALGAAAGRVSMTIPRLGSGIDSGGTHVVGGGDIELRTLDSFALEHVDFFKIDCEGYERQVVEGGRETILRCKPAIIVEQKQHIMGRNYGISGTPAVDLLKDMGYSVRREIGGDYILTC